MCCESFGCTRTSSMLLIDRFGCTACAAVEWQGSVVDLRVPATNKTCARPRRGSMLLVSLFCSATTMSYAALRPVMRGPGCMLVSLQNASCQTRPGAEPGRARTNNELRAVFCYSSDARL